MGMPMVFITATISIEYSFIIIRSFPMHGESRIVCTNLVELITSNASDSLLEGPVNES